MAARLEMIRELRVRSINDRFDLAADLRCAPGKGDLLLHFHQSIAALDLDFFGNVAVEPCRRGVRLERVGEHAGAFEARVTHEGTQLLELGFRLARRADDERGPQRQVGERLPQALNLVNGKTISDAVADPKGRVAKMVLAGKAESAIVEELYLAALSRPPSKSEAEQAVKYLAGGPKAMRAQDLLWALLNSKGFLYSY